MPTLFCQQIIQKEAPPRVIRRGRYWMRFVNHPGANKREKNYPAKYMNNPIIARPMRIAIATRSADIGALPPTLPVCPFTTN